MAETERLASDAQAPDGPSPGPVPRSVARAASGVLLVGALMTVVLLGLALRRFSASTAPGPMARYLALAAAGAGLFWCAFRLKPAARVIVAFVGLATCVLLYGTETALGLNSHTAIRRVEQHLAERTGVPFDPRTVLDVVRDLRSQGIAAVPSVVPGVVLAQSGPEAQRRTAWTSPVLPLAGIANRPTVHLCNEDGQFRRYESDEHGFANPLGTWSSPEHPLVLIGDSYTHGYCVDLDRSYAGQLRLRWPSLLNLGTGGSGPLVELATLTEYASPVRPKVVVWQYFENDLENLSYERQQPLLSRYRERAFSQMLLARQEQVDQALHEWVERMRAAGGDHNLADSFHWRQALTLYRLRELGEAWLRPRTPNLDAELALLRDTLREAASRVHEWGGRLIFVFVPMWERYYQPAALTGRDPREAVLSIARSLDLQVVDVDSAVRNHARRAELFARHELATAHFSELGHALLAREVTAAIERTGAAGTPGVR